VSGRALAEPGVGELLEPALAKLATAHRLRGFARVAKAAAQGAAILADGLAGGRHRALVETMGIRGARGTVLDHLYVISRGQARRRLGLS